MRACDYEFAVDHSFASDWCFILRCELIDDRLVEDGFPPLVPTYKVAFVNNPQGRLLPLTAVRKSSLTVLGSVPAESLSRTPAAATAVIDQVHAG